jgi:DNA-binding NtrC family response regulator
LEDLGATATSGWIGSGHVLIADDEDSVRDVGAAMLRRMGFDVLCASDGVEAMKLFREHLATIKLVVLDMTMPTMDGTETFQAMRQIQPNIPVILCSGYSETSAGVHFSEAGYAGFLQKPYRYKQMNQAVQRVLDDEKPNVGSKQAFVTLSNV